MTERTPREWPENTVPSAAQLAGWLGRCSAAERLEFATHVEAVAARSVRCFVENHDRGWAELRSMRDAWAVMLRDRAARATAAGTTPMSEEFRAELAELVRVGAELADRLEGLQAPPPAEGEAGAVAFRLFLDPPSPLASVPAPR